MIWLLRLLIAPVLLPSFLLALSPTLMRRQKTWWVVLCRKSETHESSMMLNVVGKLL
jgi:hypothetical protein